jgi:hypothetical protein
LRQVTIEATAQASAGPDNGSSTSALGCNFEMKRY